MGDFYHNNVQEVKDISHCISRAVFAQLKPGQNKNIGR